MSQQRKRKKDKKKELTPAQARKLLLKEVQLRIARCQMRVNKVLEEENCILDCSIMVTARGNFPRIEIRPKPEGEQ